MGDINYIWEKLYQGTHALASGTGSIQSRLHSAFLSFFVLGPGEFPDELQEKFADIRARLTSKPDTGNVGTLQATLEEMDNDAAVAIAGDIIDLYNAIATRYYMRDTPLP